MATLHTLTRALIKWAEHTSERGRKDGYLINESFEDGTMRLFYTKHRVFNHAFANALSKELLRHRFRAKIKAHRWLSDEGAQVFVELHFDRF